MSSIIPPEFIRCVPKTDLHVHLDGSLRLTTLLELARSEGIKLPSQDEDGLRETVFKEHYADLAEYLRGFTYTVAVLQNAENLERVACELAEDSINEGVRYMEVRFAPQLHVSGDLSIRDMVSAVAGGLERAAREHNRAGSVTNGRDLPFAFGLILCALRCFDRNMSPYYDKLLTVQSHAPNKEVFSAASLELVRTAIRLRDDHGLPIVGFDLAGEEAGYPAYYHRAAYQYAHCHFLKKTVHAGEAYGPESIFQAITDCHANRIGHGTFLFATPRIRDPNIVDAQMFVDQLVDYIASQRITVEVCLTSNLQTTPSIADVAHHPLNRMLEHNLSVSLCTDNRLTSNTTISKELELATRELSLSPKQFRDIIIAGFKGSFYAGCYNEKRAFVRKVIERYEGLEQELLG